jgi:CRP-like cAMP-binding protein
MDKAQMLKRSALFRSLSDKELDSVVSTARERSFAAGSTIIREGHPGGRGFYLILSGSAKVRKGDHLLAEFGPGDYFGEMALLLEDTPRTADVIAVTDTVCFVMTQWDFKAVVATHPEMSSKIMTELAKRLADTDRALQD